MSASSYSSNTSRVDRRVPDKIVGSCGIMVTRVRRSVRPIFAISGASLSLYTKSVLARPTNSVDDNSSLSRFDETEEAQGQGGLSAPGSANDADLLARIYFE